MSFKLKMKVLLFLVSSVVSFSAQNENFQMNIKNNGVNNREGYLISAVKRKIRINRKILKIQRIMKQGKTRKIQQNH